ncbi:oxidoreductase-like protein [Lipomyces japonicus]|uniref:oxidoreductase-like protein n=1 Tax=Lipomyces japonicus TaxID=56871 RepID=UPI0034CD97C8
MMIIRTNRIHVRKFHAGSVHCKNPYLFYDLSKIPYHDNKTNNPTGQHYFRQQQHELKIREPTAQERARIVFGSRLTGPERQRQLESQYRTILGVKVPPRPIEPDNCCMSGCVNCVWEGFKDDVQDWQVKKRAAINALVKADRLDLWPADFGPAPHKDQVKVAGSGSGSGSDEDWQRQAERKEEEAAWQGVDVGIRVFVENEARIKKRHQERLAQQQQQQQQQVAL